MKGGKEDITATGQEGSRYKNNIRQNTLQGKKKRDNKKPHEEKGDKNYLKVINIKRVITEHQNIY